MELKSMNINYEDERGIIMDVLSHIDIQHATILTSNKGSFRGNHYHKKSGQYTFLLKGELQYVSRSRTSGEVSIEMMKEKDLAFSPPNEEHGFLAKEDSLILVLTYGPRGGNDYENDTFRVSSDNSLLNYIKG